MLDANPLSVSQGLQGKIAGVNVTQTDGAPGAGMNILIRGINSFSTSTEPLYVVDGVPFEGASSLINHLILNSYGFERCFVYSYLWFARC